jgi:hypothetical protein
MEHTMTDRVMYDGINADAATIHKDFPHAQMVAGYLSGSFAWSSAEWGLFAPPTEHVTIVTNASVNAGDVLDVEAGDATPAQTQAWIAMRKRSGLYRPTIYCNLSTVGAVRAGTGPYILGKDWDLWVARWDGNDSSVYPLAVAKQEQNITSYDVSVVYAGNWPMRSALVAPPPPPHVLKSVDITAHYGDGDRTVVL